MSKKDVSFPPMICLLCVALIFKVSWSIFKTDRVVNNFFDIEFINGTVIINQNLLSGFIKESNTQSYVNQDCTFILLVEVYKKRVLLVYYTNLRGPV